MLAPTRGGPGRGPVITVERSCFIIWQNELPPLQGEGRGEVLSMPGKDGERSCFIIWQTVSLPFKGRAGERSCHNRGEVLLHHQAERTPSPPRGGPGRGPVITGERSCFIIWQTVSLPFKGRAGERSYRCMAKCKMVILGPAGRLPHQS